jgi:phosphoribosylglycinamide formyltransferase 2
LIDATKPKYTGIDEVLLNPCADVKIFGKETARIYRRMGVVVVNDALGADVLELTDSARKLADTIKVVV